VWGGAPARGLFPLDSQQGFHPCRGVGQSPTLQGIALVGCSFSSLRKNQRGPEGVSQFIPPGDTPSGLPPGLVRVIGLTAPQTPRGGGPFRGRSDGVRVRRRCAARRNCCGVSCLIPVSRLFLRNQGAFWSSASALCRKLAFGAPTDEGVLLCKLEERVFLAELVFVGLCPTPRQRAFRSPFGNLRPPYG